MDDMNSESEDLLLIDDIVVFLVENPLFMSVPAPALRNLAETMSSHLVQAGTRFIEEGDEETDIFMIVDGAFMVHRRDSQGTEHVVAELTNGSIFGHMAVTFGGFRTASFVAKADSTVLKINYGILRALLLESPDFASVVVSLARQQIRDTKTQADATVNSMAAELAAQRLRVAASSVLVHVLVTICVFQFCLEGLLYLKQHIASEAFITIPFLGIMLGIFVHMVKVSGLDLKDFGLTLRGWRMAVKDAVLPTIGFCAVITLVKMFLLYFGDHENLPLFEPLAGISTEAIEAGTAWKIWGGTLFAYICLSPVQEFIARGALQGPLQMLIVSPRKNLFAILISNLVFGGAHLYFSTGIAIGVMIPGLMWGWLYSRLENPSIVGVSLSHIFVGLYSIWFLGLEAVF